ncbi:MAG TPA: ABC transporter permease [Acidimicrobiales bacterium]
MVTWQLAQRSMMLIPRIPSTFVPSLVMPVFITISFSGAFGALSDIPAFPTDVMLDWVVPMALLQGAAFAGITTGMGIAHDVENGFFDRLLLSPSPRSALLLGPLLAAMLRACFPFLLVLTAGIIGGVTIEDWVLGVPLLLLCAVLMGVVAAAWSLALVYRIRSTSAAPLMQVGLFIVFFLSTAQVPLGLMQGWLHAVARLNPMTNVLRAARQGFLGEVTWAETWPGLLALGALVVVLLVWARRGLAKMTL